MKNQLFKIISYYSIVLAVLAANVAVPLAIIQTYGVALPEGEAVFLVYCIYTGCALAILVFAAPNLIGMMLFGPENYHRSAKSISETPVSHQKLIITYVSRGTNNAALRRALTTALAALDAKHMNFEIEVVSDIAVADELNIIHESVRYIVVPNDYVTPHKSRYKARALQYAIKQRPRVYPQLEGVWILHMDEESLLTPNALQAINSHTNNPQLSKIIGQGSIQYGLHYEKHGLFFAVMDSARTGDDIGKLRLQLRMLHKPLYGMIHGSFLLIPANIEQTIGFDAGERGSIAEDAYFAVGAVERGYRFSWLPGYIIEQSPLNLKDAFNQRRRWFRGLFLLAHDKKLTLINRLLLQ